MESGNCITICMYESSCNSLRNIMADTTDNNINIGDLEFGVLDDGTWVLLNKYLDEAFDNKFADFDWFKQVLNLSNKYNLPPVLYVNHESIKYLEHENHMIVYNILDIIDEQCVQQNIPEFNLIDAGMNFIPDKEYKTKFNKFIANTWIIHCKEHDLDIYPWVHHIRHSKEWSDRKHLLCDLKYVKYPICNLMSRAKTTRLAFYVEAHRLGFWDSNPSLTFNYFGQSDEMNRDIFHTTHYTNDTFAEKLLSNFHDVEKVLAPGEYQIDIENNYPPELGMRTPFAVKTYQEAFITISAESEEIGEYMMITEKTVLPIINLQPVHIIGQRGINRFMESLGFDMFKDIIDYDLFDDIEDNGMRAIKQTHVIYDSVIKNFDDVLAYWKKNEASMHERVCNNYLTFERLHKKMTGDLIVRPSSILNTPELNVDNFIAMLKDNTL